MKIAYYPDIDSVLLQFNGQFGDTAVNITHLALGWLNEDGRVTGISFDEATWQMGGVDLVDRHPKFAWETIGEEDVSDDAPWDRNGQSKANDATFSYYPDTDSLYIEFTAGPAARVVDITNCDYADINSDGSLNGIMISQASKVLGSDDLEAKAPEITWIVAPNLVPTA